MATLNVIYKIAADISGLQSGVNRAASAMESLDSSAKRIGTAMAGAFTVTAIVGFAKQVLDTADALTKLSDKTGIGTESLQRLEAVASASGNTLDQVASAVNQFQKRIATGAKTTVTAIEEIGLSVQALKGLSPDEQFFAIAKGLQAIKDPAEQTRVAWELFGKSGAELLPTLKADVDALKDSTVKMSAQSVAALDDFGDSIGRAATSGKNLIGELAGQLLTAGAEWNRFILNLESGGKLEQRVQELGAIAQATKGGPALPGASPLPSSPVDADAGLNLLNAGLDAQVERAKKSEEVMRQTAREIEELRREINHELSQVFVGPAPLLDSISRVGAALPTVRGLSDEMKVLDSTVRPVGSGLLFAAESSLTLAQNAAKLGVTLKTGLLGALQSVPQTLANAFTGGGNLMGAAKAIGSQLGSVIGEGIGKTFASLGSLGGPIGAALGSMVGPLVGLVGKLFGNNAEKKINPIRQAFVDAAGGLAELNGRAHEAGVTLDHLLDAKNPDAYKKAIDELNAAFQFQDDAMATLDATVQKYGFSLEELGPALQRQQLDKKAQELFQDFQVLTGAGISIDAVIGRMGESINQFFADAMRTGTEIPIAMKPMLEKMVELGQLTDANGNVITDLEASGVQFAMTMSEGFTKLIDEVKKLTDAIARGLGIAIENIPDPVVTGHVKWDVEDMPSLPSGAETDVPAFAKGGIVTGPTLAMIGEAGPEAVIPLDRLRDAGGSREPMPPMVIQLLLPNGQVLTELVVDAIEKNKRGVGTRIQRAVAA